MVEIARNNKSKAEGTIQMTDTDKLIARMRGLRFNYGADEIVPVRMSDISALCDAVEGAIPALDLLQDRLEAGASIEIGVDGRCHLFSANCDSITSGDTVRTMLQNLIFTDC